MLRAGVGSMVTNCNINTTLRLRCSVEVLPGEGSILKHMSCHKRKQMTSYLIIMVLFHLSYQGVLDIALDTFRQTF